MGTPIQDLRVGTTVVVTATVDRILNVGDHGTDAVVVRVANAIPLHAQDVDAKVTVLPDIVVEADRLLHYASEHARLSEWIQVNAPGVLEGYADTDPRHDVVNLVIDAILAVRAKVAGDPQDTPTGIDPIVMRLFQRPEA